jgi:hypothetical protein
MILTVAKQLGMTLEMWWNCQVIGWYERIVEPALLASRVEIHILNS